MRRGSEILEARDRIELSRFKSGPLCFAYVSESQIIAGRQITDPTWRAAGYGAKRRPSG